METRSKLDTSGIDFSQYTMPSPRRKGTGSGPPPATTTGLPSTTGTPTTSAVTRPVFNAAEYTLDLVSDLLVRAGLDPPITLLIPHDHASDSDVCQMYRTSPVAATVGSGWGSHAKWRRHLFSSSKRHGTIRHVFWLGVLITHHIWRSISDCRWTSHTNQKGWVRTSHRICQSDSIDVLEYLQDRQRSTSSQHEKTL
jgi:hypothetical protein